MGKVLEKVTREYNNNINCINKKENIETMKNAGL